MSRRGLRALVLALLGLLWAAPLLAQTAQVVEYYHTDALGSVRAVTKAGVVVSRHDFLPFGEELSPQIPPPDTRLFTGKERDSETGTDYFGARYSDPLVGRFTSPDPHLAAARMGEPQSWNPYAYVLNNPIRLIDPDGQKDQPFNRGDMPVTPVQGTATPAYNPDRTPNPSYYNCFSYALHGGLGDPMDPRNYGTRDDWPLYDAFGDDDLGDYRQLGTNDPNMVGDRVMYYVDVNHNGRLDGGDRIDFEGYGKQQAIIHAAIVDKVDAQGNTIVVVSKVNQWEIVRCHPDAPGFYNVDPKTKLALSRAYFRLKKGRSVAFVSFGRGDELEVSWHTKFGLER